ncbi:MAG: ComEC/Rec2 family competence protein [Candidatus Riflebacteria bacterium]|nr:ComEC/Rec2 family competence protein [Candidatus Riflebacteria bacterium]
MTASLNLNAEPNICIFTVLFIIGTAFTSILPTTLSWFFLTFTIVFSFCGFYYGKQSSWNISRIFLYIAAIFAGMYAGTVSELPQPENDLLYSINDAEITVSGYFNGGGVRNRKGNISFKLSQAEVISDKAGNIPLSLPVQLEVYQPEIFPEAGLKYLASGTCKVNQRKISLQCINFTLASSSSVLPIVASVREWIKTGYSSLLSPRHQALLTGFLIGETSSLSHKDSEIFRRTGITHLLAVSGQQVMGLAFLLAAIMSWMSIPPLSRGVLISIFLVFFALLTGGQPSVWRALLMYSAGIIVWNFESKPKTMVPVCVAAFILLLYNPSYLFNIGFQLSFLAVLGIVYAREPIELFLVHLKIPLLLSRYLAVSLGANIATIPICAWHFQMISLSSFIINPLVVWIFSLILPMGLLLSAIGHFWFTGGLILSAALSLIIDSMLIVVDAVAAIPYASIDIPQFNSIFLIAIYSLILYSIDHTMSFFSQEILSDSQIAQLKKSKSQLSDENKVFSHSDKISGVFSRFGSKKFFDPGFLRDLNYRLSNIPKRSLKNRGIQKSYALPVQKLSLEAQTIYHRLEDLSPEVLSKEPERLIQAQIYLLSLFSLEYNFDTGFESYRRSFNKSNSALLGSSDKIDRLLVTCAAFEDFLRSTGTPRKSDRNYKGYVFAMDFICKSFDYLKLLISRKFDSTEFKPEIFEDAFEKHFEFRKNILKNISENLI